MMVVDAGSDGSDGVNNPVMATGLGPQLSKHFPPKPGQLWMGDDGDH